MILQKSLEDCRNRLIFLSRLEKGWDSYGGSAPSVLASRSAFKYLERFWILPDYIAPMVDGGIEMYWNFDNISKDFESSLTFTNEGDTVGSFGFGSLKRYYEFK